MLLSGLVGSRERTRQGKARQRARQGDNRRDVRPVLSGQARSRHTMLKDAIQAGAGTEEARPLWKSRSVQADDTGWDGRALGARRGQKE